MNNTFKQLKQAWGLAADAPLEELLKSVNNKLKETPENPELLFLQAELKFLSFLRSLLADS